jgi:hypothetical protein
LTALADLDDPRALPACLTALSGEPDSIDLLSLKAAATLAHPSLLAGLRRLQEAWEDDLPDAHTNALAEALLRCAASAS